MYHTRTVTEGDIQLHLNDNRLQFEVEPTEEDKVGKAQKNLDQIQSESEDGDPTNHQTDFHMLIC